MIDYLSDEQYAARMRDLAGRIPPDVLRELAEVHARSAGCAAHNEGQSCCLADHLIRAEATPPGQ